MEHRHPITTFLTGTAVRTVAAGLLGLAGLAGCAGKGPQGYGVSQEAGTAAQAQQQMARAEQSTQPDTVQTYLDLIAQMQQAGQWYASLAHADAFEQQHGASPESRLLRANALRNTGQFAQARQAYLALLDGPTAARARRGLGLVHAGLGQYAQATEQLELARQLNPIDASVLSDLAYAQMLDGSLASAQLPILQASQLAPANARVQLNLALYWLASGNQPEASRLLQQLSHPPGKGAAPLIDQTSLQTLQTQLASVREAVRLRTDNLPAAPGTPAAPSAPVQPVGAALPPVPPERVPAQAMEPPARPGQNPLPAGITRRILLSEPSGTAGAAPASPL